MPYGKPIKLFLFKTRHHKETRISAKEQHLKGAPPQHREWSCTDHTTSCEAQLVTNSSTSSLLPRSAGVSRAQAESDLWGWGSLTATHQAFRLLLLTLKRCTRKNAGGRRFLSDVATLVQETKHYCKQQGKSTVGSRILFLKGKKKWLKGLDS